MRVLLRAILYKAVTPPYCIVDMESEVWREFLFANKTRRKEMAIQLVNRPGWSDTSIREIAWVPLDNQKMIEDIAGMLDVKVEYTATRLLFRADEIEPLAANDIIIIHTPDGTFKMTKADFYRVFSNVVNTMSYKERRIYHYWRTPKKAMEFLVNS